MLGASEPIFDDEAATKEKKGKFAYRTVAKSVEEEPEVATGSNEVDYRNRMLASDALMSEDPAKAKYVDAVRVVDFGSQDLRDTRRRTRRMQMGRSLVEDVDEEEFEEQGGLWGHLQRGKDLWQKDQTQLAQSYLSTVVRVGERAASLLPSLPTEVDKAQLILGKCLLREHCLQSAMEKVQKLLQRQPKNLEAMLLLAETLYAMSQFEKALATFHRGARTRPIIYGDAFLAGIAKCSDALGDALDPLDNASNALKALVVNHIYNAQSKNDIQTTTNNNNNTTTSKMARGREPRMLRREAMRQPSFVERARHLEDKRDRQIGLSSDVRRLNADRSYLHALQSSLDNATLASQVASDALQYIECRRRFWRRQQPSF